MFTRRYIAQARIVIILPWSTFHLIPALNVELYLLLTLDFEMTETFYILNLANVLDSHNYGKFYHGSLFETSWQPVIVSDKVLSSLRSL